MNAILTAAEQLRAAHSLNLCGTEIDERGDDRESGFMLGIGGSHITAPSRTLHVHVRSTGDGWRVVVEAYRTGGAAEDVREEFRGDESEAAEWLVAAVSRVLGL